MNIYSKLILLTALCIPFSLQAQECTSKLIDWSDYGKTLQLIKTAYHIENFSAVDNALNCLITVKNTFNSGKPGAIAAYWFFRNEMHAPGADEQDERRVKKWKEALKDSPFANFAELRLMYSQAWNARGTKFANETSDDQFNRFKEKLLQNESAIISKGNTLKETPISYNLLLAVTLDTNGTQSSAMDVFNSGVKKWPNYYDFYEVLLTRLVPKWGGSWDQVDGFINHWANALRLAEADSIYARLYYNVHSHNKIDPRSTLVDWNKLKTSLKSLYGKYPTKEHFEIAASYACIFSDYDFYSNVVSQYHVTTSEYWLRGSSKIVCDDYFNSLPNPAFKRDAP